MKSKKSKQSTRKANKPSFFTPTPNWIAKKADGKATDYLAEFKKFTNPGFVMIEKATLGHATKNELAAHITQVVGVAAFSTAIGYVVSPTAGLIAGAASITATILVNKQYRSAVADTATFIAGLIAKKVTKKGKKATWSGLVPFLWTKSVAIAKSIGASAEWVAKNIFAAAWERTCELGTWTAEQYEAICASITSAYNTPSWKVAKAN